jgi:flagellar biosynthesis regulator FlbT
MWELLKQHWWWIRLLFLIPSETEENTQQNFDESIMRLLSVMENNIILLQ